MYNLSRQNELDVQHADDNDLHDYLDTQDEPDYPRDEDSEYDEDEQALERGSEE